MKDIALAFWVLGLWSLMTASNPLVAGLALIGMIGCAWGATGGEEKK